MRKIILLIMLICLVGVSGSVFASEQPQNNFWQEMFPDGLIVADGSSFDLDNLNGKLVGLYFAAGWCRNCCAFSKVFVPFRDKYQDQIEIVLVNFDDQEKEMMSYMHNYKMHWAAIPFDSIAREGMKKKYGISEIPTLIMFTADGKMLTKDARPEFEEMGENALNYWHDLASQVKKWSDKNKK